MDDAKMIRWGILSTGHIAHEFIEGLADLPATEVVAVGSRTQASADAFANAHDIRKRHASYETLANDPEVDVIYIGTPHPFHRENSLLCLNAGKAVLCEKPFTLNAAQTREVLATAKAQGVFIMDAIWVAFLPHIVRLRELIDEGAIGEVQMVQADFGFRTEFDSQSRLFDPEMAGGSLLDVGLYPIMLAQLLLSAPTEIKSQVTLGETGVDERASMIFEYARGETALLSCAIRLKTPNEAVIMGTEGRIHLHHEWWRPGDLTLYRGDDVETIKVPAPLPGHNYEALEVNRCLREGSRESPTLTHATTLTLMETLDKLRAQWGLRYPGE